MWTIENSGVIPMMDSWLPDEGSEKRDCRGGRDTPEGGCAFEWIVRD